MHVVTWGKILFAKMFLFFYSIKCTSYFS